MSHIQETKKSNWVRFTEAQGNLAVCPHIPNLKARAKTTGHVKGPAERAKPREIKGATVRRNITSAWAHTPKITRK